MLLNTHLYIEKQVQEYQQTSKVTQSQDMKSAAPHELFTAKLHKHLPLECPALPCLARTQGPRPALTILQAKRQVCPQLSLTAEVATTSGIPEELVLYILQAQSPLKPRALL